MRIALVDQSRTIARIVGELVAADGHEVLGFTHGRAALACLEADTDIRALITSVQLGDLSGIELCAAARELAGSRRPLYVMLMSSSDDRAMVVKALDRGADDFIRKPPDVEELRARLRLADRVTCMQRELIRHATRDSLSGLLNRGEFFHRAAAAAAQAAADNPLSAIMLDVDHFKDVNDRHGHEGGDRAIVAVASQIALIEGVSGRLGGEEFGLLLAADLACALATAEELRAAIACMPLFDADGTGEGVTASFGVAQWQHGDSIDRLLLHADMALYQAKRRGRNCVVPAAASAVNRAVPQRRSVVRATARV
jgi:diguanylate cyclase (GGDEF)-like protein